MKPTKWIVITGAPCSGKTSVIRGLERLGHRVVQEVARAYLDSRLAEGLPLGQIKADPLAFERAILHRKAAVESRLPTDQTVFLDRAVPDSIAYFIIEKLNPAEVLQYSRRFRYRAVFIFDRLKYEIDGVRTEDDRMADRLDSELASGYRRLGYAPVRVPVATIGERMRMVLDAAEPFSI